MIAALNKIVNQNIPQKITNDATTILSKKEVPILCCHSIQDSNANTGPTTKVYKVSWLNLRHK
jgi:hypothetical protein